MKSAPNCDRPVTLSAPSTFSYDLPKPSNVRPSEFVRRGDCEGVVTIAVLGSEYGGKAGSDSGFRVLQPSIYQKLRVPAGYLLETID